MAMNGTEKAELRKFIFAPLNSLETEKGKIHGLWCSANPRRVFYSLLGSLILNFILIAIIIGLIEERAQERRAPACSTCPVDSCPDDWVGYRRKCYYFAEGERNWTSSKMNCSSFNASLAVVDSREEMNFLIRYKTSADHWIGLQRDQETEPWKWINGTIFNNWFHVRGGGECAYLNHRGVASSFCTREEPWICRKPLNR